MLIPAMPTEQQPLDHTKQTLLEQRRQRRMTRDRENKRRKKSEYVHELTELRATMAKLKLKISSMARAASTSVTLLPWHEVARAVEEDTTALVKSNMRLRDEIEWFRHLCSVLASAAPAPPRHHLVGAASWRDACLYQDDSLRAMGLNWITTATRANAPGALAHMALESDKSSFTNVTFDGTWIRMHVMHEKVLDHTSLDDAVQLAWTNVLLDGTSTVSHVTRLDSGRDDTVYVRHGGRPKHSLQLVQRAFREPGDDYAILVARSVMDDELHPYPAGDYKTDGQEWILVREIGPTTCLVRQIMVFSQPFFDHDHVMSLDEFVPLFTRQGARTEKLHPDDDDSRVDILRVFLDRTYSARQARFEEMLDLPLASPPSTT
ncbi:Aste57867_23086 [Aphanomyces stellatus]|uniref:Aste57867_23086 protein n=1 Tax=Aphanomyces stellatus TaxID=120398 RepID=A0A485LLX4_9STRA|nr:hypothetical protein As57867_023015 [Aphanomyces stellatus]VFT99734.1 Aste57867_23086 [Aphanomyces stellatus]